MNNGLPQGWAETPLSSVVYFQEGPGLRKWQFGESGIPFLNIRTFEKGRINRSKCQFVKMEEFMGKYEHFLLNEGDLVVSSSGTLGKVATVRADDLPLMLNTSTIRFRARYPEALTQEFLRFYVQSHHFFRQIDSAKTGSAILNYGPSHLKQMSIVLAPLGEQRRIVAKLEKLLGKVNICQQRLAKIPVLLKRFRQSVLAAACSGCLTNDWRETDAQEGELPDGWLTKKLFDICRPKQWKTISTKELTPAGFPVYGANGQIGFYSEYNHEHPTILITCRGATCGRINISEPRSYVNGNAMALDDLDETVVMLKFAAWSLEARGLEDTITGSAQPQITRTSLEIVELPIPPLAEQQEIVRRVEALFALASQLEARYAKAKAHVEKLTPSILAKAFRGELVPQDPNDEPASVLLERITEDRARTVTKSRKCA